MRLPAVARLPILILSLATLAACGDRDEAPQSPRSKAAAAAPLTLSAEDLRKAGIEVQAVHATRVSERTTLTGTVTADQTRIVKVSPLLPGRVASVAVSQGRHVHAGQTLAVLESLELGEARAAFRQAKSEAVLEDAALQRATALSRDDIVPRKDYLRAKADAERAHAALEASTAKLRMLHVAPESRGDGSAYPLVSPIDGTVIDQKAVRGGTAQADQPLFIVADLGTVWVEADVFERDLASLSVGMPARVEVAAYPGTAFDGKVIYVADTMDTATRTIKARIAVANPGRKLKSGMFAKVTLHGTTMAKAIVVPEKAVTLVQGQPAVFVRKGDGFDVRPVETEPAGGENTRIKAGLAEGERIAVSGVYELKARLLKSQIGSDED